MRKITILHSDKYYTFLTVCVFEIGKKMWLSAIFKRLQIKDDFFFFKIQLDLHQKNPSLCFYLPYVFPYSCRVGANRIPEGGKSNAYLFIYLFIHLYEVKGHVNCKIIQLWSSNCYWIDWSDRSKFIWGVKYKTGTNYLLKFQVNYPSVGFLKIIFEGSRTWNLLLTALYSKLLNQYELKFAPEVIPILYVRKCSVNYITVDRFIIF